MRLLFFFLLLYVPLRAQTDKAHRICGEWYNEKKTSRILIYEKNDKFHGKIIWLKEPETADGKPRKDVNNPKESLRNRDILGLVILVNLVYRDGRWTDGTIYAPQRGEYATCTVTLDEKKNQLSLRVSSGWLSTTVHWIKA